MNEATWQTLQNISRFPVLQKAILGVVRAFNASQNSYYLDLPNKQKGVLSRKNACCDLENGQKVWVYPQQPKANGILVTSQKKATKACLEAIVPGTIVKSRVISQSGTGFIVDLFGYSSIQAFLPTTELYENDFLFHPVGTMLEVCITEIEGTTSSIQLTRKNAFNRLSFHQMEEELLGKTLCVYVLFSASKITSNSKDGQRYYCESIDKSYKVWGTLEYNSPTPLIPGDELFVRVTKVSRKGTDLLFCSL